VLLKADYGLEPQQLDDHIVAQGFVDVKKQPLKLPIGTWHSGTFPHLGVDDRSKNETDRRVGASGILEGSRFVG
jgi:hypothetical protein